MEQNEKKGRIKKSNKKKRINGFEEWGGYMEAKKQKLNDQFNNRRPNELLNEDECTSKIFAGISIYVNGYTTPPAEDLKRLIILHGGKYHHYYSITHTSHMIASNLPDSKIKSLKGRKVVTAQWITDSIKAEKLLPDINYMLYTPEITDRQHRLQLTEVQNSPSSSTKEVFDKEHKELCDIPNLITSPQKRENNTIKSDNRAIDQSISECSGAIADDRPLKAGDPNFISEFYNRSRLHHIATSGQELKAYVQFLATNQKGKSFPQREKLKQKSSNIDCKPLNSKLIMHLDMDCFFVSVGLRSHPELKGQPVAVTHSKGKRGMPQEGSNIEYEANYYYNRLNQNLQELDDGEENIVTSTKGSKFNSDYGSLSEIASCSYEARKAGLKNGMFLGEALRLCPELKTIPYDFDGYSTVSKLLYDTVASYTLDIEAVSCDELYIDCTELLHDVKIPVEEFASVLRSEIYEKTKCTASAGIGKNMLLARLSTKRAKPNGQHLLNDSEVEEFMKNQRVKDIPGIGYSTSSRLKQLGIKTCGDLQNLSIFKLQEEFGPKTGQTLFEHCRGIDRKAVTLEKDRKSVSAEINYGIRFEQEQEIYNFINSLASEVEQRLKKINRKGRSLTLKLMIRKEDAPMETAKFMGHGVCGSLCKSAILKVATDDAKIIGLECCSLAKSLKIKPQDYRGLGIQMGKLESSTKDAGIKSIQQFLEKPSIGIKSHSPELGFQMDKLESSNKDTGMKTIEQFLEKPSTSTKNHSAEDLGVLSTNTEELAVKSNENIRTRVVENQPNQNSQEAYYHQLSQMDESVLNALPEELRREILSAQIKKQERSPKKISPTKGNKIPLSKRGRPGGVRAWKPPKTGSPQKTIIDYQKTVSSKKMENLNTVPVSAIVPCKKKASLGGTADIDEVRQLLKEWVTTVEIPIVEDINYLKDYMIELIEEDLEKTDLVLKCFYRLVSAAGLLWKEAYLLLLSYVQQKMLQDVGHMLKANDSFDNM